MKRNILCLISLLALLFVAVPKAQAQDLRTSSGSYIGRIESGGRIYNGSGSYIGEARGVRPDWAAAYFFFFRF